MSLAAMMSCRKSGPPYSPEESLSKLQIANGFRVELAAAEPQVLDPIAAAFDERGRMYVVEMSDYPNSNQPKGQIRMLEDCDGDGRYSSPLDYAKSVFAANGSSPDRLIRALQPYDEAVAVQAASLCRSRGMDLTANPFRDLIENAVPAVRQGFVAYQRLLPVAK